MSAVATEAAAPCELLEWDSGFFGFRIARLSGERLDPARTAAADLWCRQNGVRCLYFLSSADHPETVSCAEGSGFRLVDARLTLARRRGASPNGHGTPLPGVRLRAARAEDLPALRVLAGRSHTDSRFYFDSNFPRQLCDRFYETWIDASCNGFADAVWVAEMESGAVGYITCHKEPDRPAGRIGLLGVSEEARGKSLGQALVQKAFEWLISQGAEEVTVVTQGRNVAAQRLYQRCGFLTQSLQLWYHKWYPAAEPAGPSGGGYRIPFNRVRTEGSEHRYIQQALAEGQISGDGTFVQKCEDLLEQLFKIPRVLLTTSGTHALEMCALLLDLKPGDEVRLPYFTFVSTANAFVLRGARPVFADIRADTLNLDESRLERLITRRTKAIVPVHYAGVGCEMDRILQFAGRAGVPVVEDNAHGLFARTGGKPLGTFGALAAHSFHGTKNLTCGEGGALFINDPKYLERAEIIRDKGTNRRRFVRGEVDRYTWVDLGSSYAPSGILAAFLYAQIEVRDKIRASRKRVWERYQSRLRDWAAERGVGLPFVPDRCEQSFHMFYLILPSQRQRDALMDHLRARGILSVFHYVPLHRSEMGRRSGGPAADCPVTDRVSERLLRLPFYNGLSEEDQEEVIKGVLGFHG